MKKTLFAAVLLFAACHTSTVARQNPYSTRPEAAQAGAKLFVDHCAQCHGADASGHGSAPSLKSESVQERSDTALFAFLRNGDLRHGMPSWSRLTDERRWQIVTYLRTLRPSGP